MSSTGRNEDVRRPHDHYVTPPWAVERLLEAYKPRPGTWMDPCAAKGELINTVRRLRPDVHFIGIELRPECHDQLDQATGGHSLIGDFFEAAKQLPDKSVDTVITNFPFSLADQFRDECVRIAHTAITLQRINWFRGDGRHVQMAALNPGLFVLPDRPSFTGFGTDSTEYAWYVFGDPAVAGRWFMLGETPEEVRAEWNEQARILHPESNPKLKKVA